MLCRTLVPSERVEALLLVDLRQQAGEPGDLLYGFMEFVHLRVALVFLLLDICLCVVAPGVATALCGLRLELAQLRDGLV